MKSDKRKFKDKAFINRWSASQIKHITAKSTSRSRQKSCLTSIIKVLRSVRARLFVSRCRRSSWRFFCKEYLASTLSIIFELLRGLLQIVVNVKVNKYHCFGKCNTCLIPRVPILGFCLLRLNSVVMKKSCCCHFYIPWCCSTGISHVFILHHFFV